MKYKIALFFVEGDICTAVIGKDFYRVLSGDQLDTMRSLSPTRTDTSETKFEIEVDEKKMLEVLNNGKMPSLQRK